MIDGDLFTSDTPIGKIFNEFGRLSGMDDDLFTYEVKIPKLSYFPSVEQQMDDLNNRKLDVYERKVCYDECKKIYDEALIFINKKLVRFIDVTVELWLDLKYDDHMMVSNEIYESVIATWLIRSYKRQLEECMEIKKQKENRHAKWPTCNWKKEKYCNGGDLPGVIQIRDEIYFESYEWYENPKDGELKDEALNCKAMREESMNVEEESSGNARNHRSPSDEWEDLEHDETQGNDKQVDEHEPMNDNDDDISDLEDYLIRKVPPYYVNKEEENSRKEYASYLESLT
uniref:Uncharacterized protein n=1 Tax=Tanacetum cinerariifolium TaxID=118510 RepID=A0A699L6D9_TANCI|nr:hypothetical protein [Tanacetum cinerariifolium]